MLLLQTVIYSVAYSKNLKTGSKNSFNLHINCFVKLWKKKGKFIPNQPLQLKISAQGGVGTAEEHQFLLEHYQVDSVGWGSPFLLVSEATSVDTPTRKLLAEADEEDLYLSDISPLGVPFNCVKGMSNDSLKKQRINKNKAGSSCPKKYLALNKTYDKQGWCTASRKYQKLQLKDLELNKENLSKAAYLSRFTAITEKACLCVGLSNASLIEHQLPLKGEAQGVVICPGPNIAYFTEETSLKNMVNHIYGRHNLIHTANRPHFFIKELRMYVEHYTKEKALLDTSSTPVNHKKNEKLKNNILKSISYYQALFEKEELYFKNEKAQILEELALTKHQLCTSDKTLSCEV